MKPITKTLLCILSALIILLLCFFIYVIIYKNPQDKLLKKSRIIEKQATVGNVTFNYAEGPDNGPALVLLHAQLLDWYTYSKVLPELSENFHVYAIDYPGHGKTIIPDDYEMSANQIGTDLGRFIDEIIQEKVFVTGNSSGGLLTTWLAANRPDIVKAVVLEDPPLFSAEYDVVKTTVANKAFTQSHNALSDPAYDGDYLMYWLNNRSNFFATYVFKGSEQIIKTMVNTYRAFHPDEPIEIAFMPASVQEMLRGLDSYNPRFGQAFYDGSWNKDFDHAEALSKIECPVCLIQADFGYLSDGTLDGAMSEEMANTAMSLLKDGTYIRVNSGHVTNLEVPDQFVDIITQFFLEK